MPRIFKGSEIKIQKSVVHAFFTTPTSAGRTTLLFSMNPTFITCPTVPSSFAGSGYSYSASWRLGSNFSPASPNFVRPFLANALVRPSSVILIPSYSVARTGWFSMSARYSEGTDSSALDRLSDVSRRDLAKDVTANDLAALTSRLAMRRVFSCSARLRRSWSFRSFTCASSSSSLVAGVSSASPSVAAFSPPSSGVFEAVSSSSFVGASSCGAAFPASLKVRTLPIRGTVVGGVKETTNAAGLPLLWRSGDDDARAALRTNDAFPLVDVTVRPCRTRALATAKLRVAGDIFQICRWGVMVRSQSRGGAATAPRLG
mmetsp:Transcript_530/g.691  ORF Transcript_530/g.691 Transcript_530/m.691 type:complete len:316 (+) Transcript_530:237-1184(+)